MLRERYIRWIGLWQLSLRLRQAEAMARLVSSGGVGFQALRRQPCTYQFGVDSVSWRIITRVRKVSDAEKTSALSAIALAVR